MKICPKLKDGFPLKNGCSEEREHIRVLLEVGGVEGLGAWEIATGWVTDHILFY